MKLKTLTLKDFRNYVQCTLTLSSGMHCIVGDNGRGKTNLLEAIHFLSTGRSFRTADLTDLIRHGAPCFYVEAHFEKEGIDQTLKASFDGKTRRLQYNQTHYPYFTSLLGILPSVLYAPEDLALISGNPADRRRFLDLLIAQIDPLYVHHLGRYYKAMKQRNTLLKQKREETLSAWEQVMAHAAHYLLPKRQQLIRALQEPAVRWMQRLSLGKQQVSLSYHSSIPLHTQEDVAAYLKKNRARDLLLGSTQSGPHRDDLTIQIDGRCARSFSSEGQKRCASAALRFAQWEMTKNVCGETPFLCIDDFGIQLDPERQAALQHHLQGLGQVFLTSPVASEGLLPEIPRQTIQVSALV